MITIQSGMLIVLGFLAASLLGLLVAPAFWSRAVRLTTRRIKETIPLSDIEIEADRDRIRAEYAIKMHKLETLVEQVKLAAARQQIEINRRDARVNMLEADLEQLRASYEEAQNARRVLEQTIQDRLPRVESRLSDAKKLLFSREREIGDLSQTAERQIRALAEASSINVQQQGEIERLTTTLSSRLRIGDGAQRAESEAVLRAEIEALRGKMREQTQLLERMQSLAGRPLAASEVLSGASDSSPGGALAAANSDAAKVDLERQVRGLRSKTDDQAAEIARLRAAIAVFEAEPDGDGKGAMRETRIAIKARLQSLEAQAVRQDETIVKLRGELAAANERLARQAAHFTGELKRLGPSGSAANGRNRKATIAPRTSLADRVAQARGSASEASEPSRDASSDAPPDADKAGASEEVGPVAAVEPALALVGAADRGPALSVAAANPAVDEVTKSGSDAAAAAVAAKEPAKTPGKARPRLLDRIAGLSRGS